jgi:hypothetical protein
MPKFINFFYESKDTTARYPMPIPFLRNISIPDGSQPNYYQPANDFRQFGQESYESQRFSDFGHRSGLMRPSKVPSNESSFDPFD